MYIIEFLMKSWKFLGIEGSGFWSEIFQVLYSKRWYFMVFLLHENGNNKIEMSIPIFLQLNRDTEC